MSAIYFIYIAQIVCFPCIHVGLLQRVGFKAVYLIVQPGIERLYNAPNALKLYMHPLIWALWGHAEAEIMHQYCNIHSPPLDAHVLINPDQYTGIPQQCAHIYEPLSRASYIFFTLYNTFSFQVEFVFHQSAKHFCIFIFVHVCDIFRKAKTKIGL